MCVKHDLNKEHEFLTKNISNKYFYGYKWLRGYNSPVMHNATYKQGWNYAKNYNDKRIDKNYNGDDYDNYNFGIHVWLSKADANSNAYTGSGYRLIKVKCLMTDFIKADGEQAAFKKVYIESLKDVRNESC